MICVAAFEVFGVFEPVNLLVCVAIFGGRRCDYTFASLACSSSRIHGPTYAPLS